MPIFNVPWERRKQTAAVMIAWSGMFCWVGLALTMLLWSNVTRSIIAIYLIWMVYDERVNRSTERGMRRFEPFRSVSFFKLFRDYFPIRLIKTAELDPSRHYVFGYHPHGVIGMGAFLCFATEAEDFSKKFPGIQTSLLTLKAVLRIPVWRDLMMMLGICDASRATCDYHLQHHKSICLVVGGAREALDARPGSMTLTLAKRYGFVKEAIKNQAALVPVISFGENDLFDQVGVKEGSFLRAMQDGFRKVFGFSTPLFLGRGVFNYSFGLMPHRRPINVVVGAAILTEPLSFDARKTKKLSLEQKAELDALVHKYHTLYIERLTALFNDHKDKYGSDQTLKIL